MKNLKYLLFMGILMFFLVDIVSAASCTYGDKNFFIKCTTNSIGIIDGTASCTIGGTNVGDKYVAGDASMPSNSVVEKCDKIYYYLAQDSSQVRRQISGFYGDIDSLGWGSDKKHMYPLSKMSSDDEGEVNADLSKFNGKACAWEVTDGSNKLKYICKISVGSPSCQMHCVGECSGYGLSGISQENANNFTNSDFIKDGDFSCPSNVYLDRRYNSFSSKWAVYGVNKSKGLKMSYTPNLSTSPGSGGVGDGFGSGGTGSGSGGTGSGGNSDPGTGGGTSDPSIGEAVEQFCTGKVLGIFTAIGWVIFIVKVLVPIILIVFGCIDIGKAVIASKDDEIKKSVKSLIMRVIAGIVIFFVPNVLDIIIEVVGDRANGVYKGTFADCTSCILDPTQNTCTTVVGGD